MMEKKEELLQRLKILKRDMICLPLSLSLVILLLILHAPKVLYLLPIFAIVVLEFKITTNIWSIDTLIGEKSILAKIYMAWKAGGIIGYFDVKKMV